MNKIDENFPSLSVNFGDELIKNSNIHMNVKQIFIITTEDKIRIAIEKNRKNFAAQRDWWIPFGILITLVGTLCTAEFKNSFGITKEYWFAIFVCGAIISFGFLLKSLYVLYKNWGHDNPDDIVDSIKLNKTSGNIKETIEIPAKKNYAEVPILENIWHQNHWGGNCSSINDKKMFFTGTTVPSTEGADGSHINIDDILEIGKTYEISCFVKAALHTTGKFRLWCHDETGTGNSKVNATTDFTTPSPFGEEIKLNFTPLRTKNIRIHLQYMPGEGCIEVSDVRITELKI